jgi:single-strand DNA-binding protein
MIGTAIGRLGADAQLKYIGESKTPVLNFSVAEDKFRNGEKVAPNWWRCQLFGPPAEKRSKFYQKGREIFIAGALNSRSWEDSDGNKRIAYELTCDPSHTKLTAARAPGGNGDTEKPAETKPPENVENKTPAADDDIPF